MKSQLTLALLSCALLAGCRTIQKPAMKSVDCTDWRAATLETYETQVAVSARRPLWDFRNRMKDWRSLRKLEAEIAIEDSQYKDEMRAIRREEIMYERQRQKDLHRSGATVLKSKVGIDVHQQMHYGRPRIDLVALEQIAREQAAAQKLVDRQRIELRKQDQVRREQLAATGGTCDDCGCCGCCTCPIPEPMIREPIVDVPTSIPLVLNARLDLNFNNSGYEEAEVVRVPAPREPVVQRMRQECRDPRMRLPQRMTQPPVSCAQAGGVIGDNGVQQYHAEPSCEAIELQDLPRIPPVEHEPEKPDSHSGIIPTLPSFSSLTLVPGGERRPL